MFRMDIPSSNDDRVDVETGSESTVLLESPPILGGASPIGVGGVTSTGMFFFFVEVLGERTLSRERSRLAFDAPKCSSPASFFTTFMSSRLFLLKSSGLLLALGGREAVGGGATVSSSYPRSNMSARERFFRVLSSSSVKVFAPSTYVWRSSCGGPGGGFFLKDLLDGFFCCPPLSQVTPSSLSSPVSRPLILGE